MKLDEKTTVRLDDVLEHITRNVYDYWHGLGPKNQWTLDMIPFMDMLAERLGATGEELGNYFDEIRYRVHGKRD